MLVVGQERIDPAFGGGGLGRRRLQLLDQEIPLVGREHPFRKDGCEPFPQRGSRDHAVEKLSGTTEVDVVARDGVLLDAQVLEDGRRTERKYEARTPPLIGVSLHGARTQRTYQLGKIVEAVEPVFQIRKIPLVRRQPMSILANPLEPLPPRGSAVGVLGGESQ